ncbi:phage major capsid protein [Microbacterium sp. TPD7012]|uniref:phage major capsid protein n=1 Tax=Microbacterium sp. TPD7012 TaxID=2171975 RepID=UPI000D5221FF|nr:phage major capsid protein [Microbacterium sp. TPD7012]PVE94997.1 phage major capsid protein [Microbacterium sp. TPD7012]
MAITAATKTSDFAGFLKPEQAEDYFEQARRQSVVQTLTRQVPLGINGQEIPVVTTKPTAGWVAEGGQKPATSGAVGLKTITPKKIAAIAVVSAEVVRANPANYVNIFRDDIAEAFAVAFDAAALHGTNSPFGAGNNIDATTKVVEMGTTTQANGGIYGDLNAGLKLLVDAKKKLTGFALDTTAEPLLNGAVDLNGRPLFVEAPYENTALDGGRLLRRPAFYGEGISTPIVNGTPNTGGIVAYGGDWSQAVWGSVGGISYDVSTQATVTINGVLTSLWENNLVAIRAEAEYGWLVNDAQAFVKYTNHTA